MHPLVLRPVYHLMSCLQGWPGSTACANRPTAALWTRARALRRRSWSLTRWVTGLHWLTVCSQAADTDSCTSLGILHDGTGNNCDPDKYIMSEKTGPGKINWSPCSNIYLDNFLTYIILFEFINYLDSYIIYNIMYNRYIFSYRFNIHTIYIGGNHWYKTNLSFLYFESER